MSVHEKPAHESPIIRRQSRQIMVGNVPVGAMPPSRCRPWPTPRPRTWPPPSSRSSGSNGSVPISSGSPCLPWRRRKPSNSSSSRPAFPSSPISTSTTASPWKWPSTVPTACASTRATSAMSSGCVPWSTAPATSTSRSASGSMAGRWRRISRRSTANRPRRRWWNPPCVTWIIWPVSTSRTSRWASRPPMCSSRLAPIVCWPSRSSSRCTLASLRRAVSVPVRSNPPSALACCWARALAIPCASPWPPIRWKR